MKDAVCYCWQWGDNFDTCAVEHAGKKTNCYFRDGATSDHVKRVGGYSDLMCAGREGLREVLGIEIGVSCYRCS